MVILEAGLAKGDPPAARMKIAFQGDTCPESVPGLHVPARSQGILRLPVAGLIEIRCFGKGRGRHRRRFHHERPAGERNVRLHFRGYVAAEKENLESSILALTWTQIERFKF